MVARYSIERYNDRGDHKNSQQREFFVTDSCDIVFPVLGHVPIVSPRNLKDVVVVVRDDVFLEFLTASRSWRNVNWIISSVASGASATGAPLSLQHYTLSIAREIVVAAICDNW